MDRPAIVVGPSTEPVSQRRGVRVGVGLGWLPLDSCIPAVADDRQIAVLR